MIVDRKIQVITSPYGIRKRYSNYTSGSFNYTISWANGNSSDPRQGYDHRAGSKELPIRENPLDWDERHVMSATLDFRVRRDENPEIFGFTLPDRWGINLSWQYGSGKPFSPDAELSGNKLAEIDNNSMRKPWTMNTDLRFNKDFTYSGIDYSVFLWVENLFNRKNVQEVFSSSGKPNQIEHEGEEREYTFYEGNGTILSEGQYYKYNPTHPYLVNGASAYAPRRRIMAGLQINW